MARTKGSGWGGGTILYQKCPKCGKKKVMYDGGSGIRDLTSIPFKCTSCKHRFNDSDLIREQYAAKAGRQF